MDYRMFPQYATLLDHLDKLNPVTAHKARSDLHSLLNRLTAETSIRHVSQLDEDGCGVAALAMLVGSDYYTVKCDLIKRGHLPAHGRTAGISCNQMCIYLQDRGYGIAMRYVVLRGESAHPFARAHFVNVNSHFVVMTRSGVVLDPAYLTPRRLDDYEIVRYIGGLAPLL